MDEPPPARGDEAEQDEAAEAKAPEAGGLPLDSRKTAEAIMKKTVPELYEALRDSGEIEE